jgi:hypothetical protein
MILAPTGSLQLGDDVVETCRQVMEAIVELPREAQPAWNTSSATVAPVLILMMSASVCR